ncbi:DUF317 domain-containing protein [Streptomyces shenzhenensis]|uniref:DUF317 domain-containing protein n=1 Tax=Streptomyces shenzhenensis TaxID=943815 RepID=UPI003822C10F
MAAHLTRTLAALEAPPRQRPPQPRRLRRPGPDSTLTAWTISAGADMNRPDWAINASAHTPAGLLTRLAEELAHGTGRRTTQRITQTAATLPPEPSRGPSIPPRR